MGLAVKIPEGESIRGRVGTVGYMGKSLVAHLFGNLLRLLEFWRSFCHVRLRKRFTFSCVWVARQQRTKSHASGNQKWAKGWTTAALNETGL